MAAASGKVILLGEHSVVYGHPAVVAGIENGAQASVARDTVSSITVGSHTEATDQGTLGAALTALLAAIDAPPVRAHVHLHIPAGCGLGASAATGVAVARATLELLEPTDTESQTRRDAILRAAQAWERVFHGNPSGIDAAAATLGGCFAFNRTGGPQSIALPSPLHLAVAIADAPASTKAMVDKVMALRAADPDRIDRIFARIAQLVKAAIRAIEEGSAIRLGELMSQNHACLQGLDVSTHALDNACDWARSAGALGAKMTGSGGGGCVIALCAESPRAVLDLWSSRGLSCFPVVVRA
jgi:mevalonate kinase